jgi:hypothetical protein
MKPRTAMIIVALVMGILRVVCASALMEIALDAIECREAVAGLIEAQAAERAAVAKASLGCVDRTGMIIEQNIPVVIRQLLFDPHMTTSKDRAPLPMFPLQHWDTEWKICDPQPRPTQQDNVLTSPKSGDAIEYRGDWIIYDGTNWRCRPTPADREKP